jgi:hypothetical protein
MGIKLSPEFTGGSAQQRRVAFERQAEAKSRVKS